MLRRLELIFASFIMFFLLLFVFLKLIGPIPFAVNSIATTKTDTFTVTGEGTSSQKPDTAVVRVGVTASSQTVKLAQDQLNTNINKVSAAIKNLGVESKDIKTENYNLSPTYDYLAGNQKISGYSASSNLVIKVRVIDKINSVIDAATSNGANQVSGVQFEVADTEKAENEARQKAVEQARKKAEQAAKIAGFKLGNVINYSENQGGGIIKPPMLYNQAAIAQKDLKTEVEPGSSEIKISVSLSYQIL